MTSWGDEDLRCVARMQCYPNSSAMLIRSIIKQRNPRLKCPIAEDWGNQCSMQEQHQTPPGIPQCLTGVTEGSHSHTPHQHFYKHQLFYYQKMCSVDHLSAFWVNWQYLAAGAWVKQCCIWVKLTYGANLCGLGCRVYLPWVENYRHDPSFQLTVGHHSAHFYWQKKSKECQRASTTAKEL